MKLIVILIIGSVYCLHAATTSLETFLLLINSSDIVKSIKTDKIISLSNEKSKIFTTGILLNSSLSHASMSDINKKSNEYRASVEKNILLGDSNRYIDTLDFSLQQQQNLEINRVKNIVFKNYVNACAFKEKIDLISNRRDKNIALGNLIKDGVEGGEFELSALLRNQIEVDRLNIDIESFKSKYNQFLENLNFYANAKSLKPECSDLTYEADIQKNMLESSILYNKLESEIDMASSLSDFYKTPVSNITLGVGYEHEIDLSRSTIYVQVPLSAGGKLKSQREYSRAQYLNAKQKFLIIKNEMESRARSYENFQKSLSNSLEKLNSVMLVKAYEITKLLEEKFIGLEGSYMEYINSQEVLFELLIKKVDIQTELLMAKIELYSTLGVDPLKDAR